jgi:hypothetical protein
MKKVLCFLLLSASAFAMSPAVDKAHKASLHVGQATLSGHVFCSATAIGPQAVLTATHCELPDETLYIENANPAEIVGRIRDGQDHTIYLLKGATFADYVLVDLKDPVEVSEDIFTFGNPGDWDDVYQRGYIASIQKDRSLAASLGDGYPDTILLDLQAFPGESGAGIFNAKGDVIAVLSGDQHQVKEGVSIDLASAYPMAFKQEDLDKARTFVTTPEAK